MNVAEREAGPRRYHLLLIVAGSGLRSRRAITNLRKVCAEDLHGNVDVEVIDIYENPALAKTHQIVALPTLLKLVPLPIRRIIGDLSERERVIEGLDLIAQP